MVVENKEHAKSCFVLQVAALRAKREQELEELKNELNALAGVITDTHLREKVDAYFAWSRTTGQVATLREIKGVKEGIRQLVRPIFCYGLHFLIQQSSTFHY